jgi:hypothetical protein
VGGPIKKWVWVPKRVDSNVPGHWAEEGSEGASAHNVQYYKPGVWVDR